MIVKTIAGMKIYHFWFLMIVIMIWAMMIGVALYLKAISTILISLYSVRPAILNSAKTITDSTKTSMITAKSLLMVFCSMNTVEISEITNPKSTRIKIQFSEMYSDTTMLSLPQELQYS